MLLTPVGLALLEAVVTIFGRGGKEYKWLVQLDTFSLQISFGSHGHSED